MKKTRLVLGGMLVTSMVTLGAVIYKSYKTYKKEQKEAEEFLILKEMEEAKEAVRLNDEKRKASESEDTDSYEKLQEEFNELSDDYHELLEEYGKLYAHVHKKDDDYINEINSSIEELKWMPSSMMTLHGQEDLAMNVAADDIIRPYEMDILRKLPILLQTSGLELALGDFEFRKNYPWSKSYKERKVRRPEVYYDMMLSDFYGTKELAILEALWNIPFTVVNDSDVLLYENCQERRLEFFGPEDVKHLEDVRVAEIFIFYANRLSWDFYLPLSDSLRIIVNAVEIDSKTPFNVLEERVADLLDHKFYNSEDGFGLFGIQPEGLQTYIDDYGYDPFDITSEIGFNREYDVFTTVYGDDL